jgi:site-specific recombinase XerD
MTEPSRLPAVRTENAADLPGASIGEEVADYLRAELGTVRLGYRPGDPVIGRLDLLAQICDRDTFQAVIRWLSSGKRRSRATRRAYADDVRHWAGFAAGLGRRPFRLGSLRYADVSAWRLVQESRGVSGRSMARRLSSLSSLHEHASRHGWEGLASPVDAEDHRPRVDRHDTSSATPVVELAELQALAAAAGTVLEALVVLLLYTLAGRVSEMCALDLDARIVRPGRVSLDLTRKGGKQRVLPLPATVAGLLELHVGDRTAGPLLVADGGGRVDRFAVDRIVTRLGRRAGVLPGRDVTPHVMRASRITHMIDAGEPLAEIQAFADHADPSTTIGYFTRRKAAERNARLVDATNDLFTDITSRWTGVTGSLPAAAPRRSGPFPARRPGWRAPGRPYRADCGGRAAGVSSSRMANSSSMRLVAAERRRVARRSQSSGVGTLPGGRADSASRISLMDSPTRWAAPIMATRQHTSGKNCRWLLAVRSLGSSPWSSYQRTAERAIPMRSATCPTVRPPSCQLSMAAMVPGDGLDFNHG